MLWKLIHPAEGNHVIYDFDILSYCSEICRKNSAQSIWGSCIHVLHWNFVTGAHQGFSH